MSGDRARRRSAVGEHLGRLDADGGLILARVAIAPPFSTAPRSARPPSPARCASPDPTRYAATGALARVVVAPRGAVLGAGGRPAIGDYVAGYQNVPVSWGINTDRKRGFVALVKEITGV